MKTPLVSVIIPMYNTGASCLELIKTLQESTYKNIEIICIDDDARCNGNELFRKRPYKRTDGNPFGCCQVFVKRRFPTKD